MEDKAAFEERTIFRMFSEQKREIDRICKYAAEDDGGRKYENQSHFIRAAIMQLIGIEMRRLKRKTGRPLK